MRRDPLHRRTWVMVTDGERALQRRVCTTFKGVTLVLDLLHVLEKLWAVSYVFHPEGSAEAEAFVRERASRILHDQVGKVVKGLRQMSTKRRLTGAKAKTVADVTGSPHYQRNRERMRYDVYLKNGWPIASGSVEGACKHLVRGRFERSGMRWSPWPKRCSSCVLSTSQATSIPTGSSMPGGIRRDCIRRGPGESSENSPTRISWQSSPSRRQDRERCILQARLPNDVRRQRRPQAAGSSVDCQKTRMDTSAGSLSSAFSSPSTLRRVSDAPAISSEVQYSLT